MLFGIEHISKKGEFLKSKDLNDRNLRASIIDLKNAKLVDTASVFQKVYHFGIIDYLTKYDNKKKFERNIKSLGTTIKEDFKFKRGSTWLLLGKIWKLYEQEYFDTPEWLVLG